MSRGVLRRGSGGGTRLTITPPGDYVFRRDACSYGYFLLAPNRWDPDAETLHTVVAMPEGKSVGLAISQPAPRGEPATRAANPKALRGRTLRIEADRLLEQGERGEVRRGVRRMLRLDEPTERIRAFHRVDPRWRASGRGRLFRSASFFEDVVKTVTSCNVTWPGTVMMNARLCAVVGEGGAFPTAARLARTRASTLRARCRVGYRDRRLIELAGLFAGGAIDESALADPSRDDAGVFKELQGWPGVGPYAAANIMQLLGRYGRLPLDTESVRHGRVVLGMSGSARAIMRRVHEHFEPFGEHAFRSYWFELWRFYESRKGPSWTWEPRKTATAFTASQLG